jgi:hypothetical protein
MVVDKSTLLRRTTAIQDSSHLTAFYPSPGGGRGCLNAVLEDWMLK